MTQKLYWDDPYAVDFTAKVVSKQNGGIILDRTLFFPSSGNQASDKGFLQYGEDQSSVDAVDHHDKIIFTFFVF